MPTETIQTMQRSGVEADSMLVFKENEVNAVMSSNMRLGIWPIFNRLALTTRYGVEVRIPTRYSALSPYCSYACNRPKV
jgi:hypothetical protein